MGLLACHGVFRGFRSSYARLAFCGFPVYFRYVNERIIGYHALIHAVECQAISRRTPEQTALNAKLVAVYGFSIHYVSRTIGSKLVDVSGFIANKQLVFQHVSHSPRHLIICLNLRARHYFDGVFNPFGLEIDG